MGTEAWTESELPDVRRRAVALRREGESAAEVAAMLDVTVQSVRRWWAAWGSGGAAALANRPRSGWPPKLTPAQVGRVLGWIDRSPSEFGFANERWTAPRVAAVIAERLGVDLHPRYLNDWLRRHGPVTPQVPERRAYERDEAAVAAWLRHRWPAIKKRRGPRGRPCCSRTRAGSSCCPWSARRSPGRATRPC